MFNKFFKELDFEIAKTRQSESLKKHNREARKIRAQLTHIAHAAQWGLPRPFSGQEIDALLERVEAHWQVSERLGLVK